MGCCREGMGGDGWVLHYLDSRLLVAIGFLGEPDLVLLSQIVVKSVGQIESKICKKECENIGQIVENPKDFPMFRL